MWKKIKLPSELAAGKRFNYKEIILILLSLGLGIYLGWKILEIAIFVIFVLIILRPLPSKFPAALALISLIAVPIFLVFGQENISEQMAIYAYYFLIMSVMMGIYEIWQEDKKDKAA